MALTMNWTGLKRAALNTGHQRGADPRPEITFVPSLEMDEDGVEQLVLRAPASEVFGIAPRETKDEKTGKTKETYSFVPRIEVIPGSTVGLDQSKGVSLYTPFMSFRVVAQ